MRRRLGRGVLCFAGPSPKTLFDEIARAQTVEAGRTLVSFLIVLLLFLYVLMWRRWHALVLMVMWGSRRRLVSGPGRSFPLRLASCWLFSHSRLLRVQRIRGRLDGRRPGRSSSSSIIVTAAFGSLDLRGPGHARQRDSSTTEKGASGPGVHFKVRDVGIGILAGLAEAKTVALVGDAPVASDKVSKRGWA